MVTVPATIITSACLGEDLGIIPIRSKSCLLAADAIISIAQHAKPNWKYHGDVDLAHPKILSNDATMTLIDAISKTKTRLNVSSTSSVARDMRFIIDEEIFQIKEVVNATTLVVYRGFDDTTAAAHLENSVINLLTGAGDSDAIEPGDDFGFSGLIEDFTDSQEYG